MTTLGTITHSGVELVEIRTLTGGDRVAVRAIQVEHRIFTGEHTDRIAVGSQAAGTGTTNAAWTNTGGTVNAISALLIVDGGSGPGALTGSDLLAVDDTGDVAANTGELTTRSPHRPRHERGHHLHRVRAAHDRPRLGRRHLHDPLHPHRHDGAHDQQRRRHRDHPQRRGCHDRSAPVRMPTPCASARRSADIGGVLTGIAAHSHPRRRPGCRHCCTSTTPRPCCDRVGVVTGGSVTGLGMTGGAPKPSLVQVRHGARRRRRALRAHDRRSRDDGAAGVRRHRGRGAGTRSRRSSARGTSSSPRRARAGRSRGRARSPETPAGRAPSPSRLSPATPLVAAGAGVVTTGVLAMTDGRVDYGQFETLDLTLGSGSDVLNIDSTHAGTTAVHAASGDDRIFVEALSGTTTIQGQARRRLARGQRRSRPGRRRTRWPARC